MNANRGCTPPPPPSGEGRRRWSGSDRKTTASKLHPINARQINHRQTTEPTHRNQTGDRRGDRSRRASTSWQPGDERRDSCFDEIGFQKKKKKEKAENINNPSTVKEPTLMPADIWRSQTLHKIAWPTHQGISDLSRWHPGSDGGRIPTTRADTGWSPPPSYHRKHRRWPLKKHPSLARECLLPTLTIRGWSRQHRNA